MNNADKLQGEYIPEIARMQSEEHEEILKMLDDCLTSVEGDALEFIESLNDQYEVKGYLTDKQLTALESFYLNL